jgi:hypothetical protein
MTISPDEPGLSERRRGSSAVTPAPAAVDADVAYLEKLATSRN